MSVTFRFQPERGYFESLYEGRVTVDDMKAAYGSLSLEQVRGLNELVDLTAVIAHAVDAASMSAAAQEAEAQFNKLGLAPRTAIFAPKDLPFGMARIYEGWASMSPESVRVFRVRADAEAWLQDREQV